MKNIIHSKNLSQVFKSSFVALTMLFGLAFATAQTNPTAQALPYNQNFGTTTFTAMPTGMAAWNTFGSNLTTQANAEASVSTGNATVATATASTTTGGMYGYATSSNARAYIQQSSNATNGTNQIVAAISTGTATAITVSYQLELINGGVTTQDFGVELQYRAGTTGSWTNVCGSVITFGAVTTYTTSTLSYNITGLTASTNYQIRWIVWRPSGSGASKGIGIDNIAISANTGTPAITGTATATAFTTTYGTASGVQSFSIGGTNLTANLVATAPTGFEVSSNGTTYGSTATFTQICGTATGTLRVRLSNTAIPGTTSYDAKIITLAAGTASGSITTSASGNSVTAKALTISGLVADNKTQDGNANATFTGTPVLNGVVNSDSVSLTGTGTATFNDATTADNKTVTITGFGLTGANASNYTLTTYTTTANITSPSLQNQTITFGTLANKVYGDANYSPGAISTNATISITYASSNTAVADIVSGNIRILGVGTTTITASQAGDASYNAATSVQQSLTVTAKALTVTGASVPDKTYDGTVAATINGATLFGIVGIDNVTISGGGVFVDANVGSNIAITTSFTLGGTDAAKYSVTQPTTLTGNINKASQTITFGALAARATTDAPFALTATGGASGNAVTYVSSNTGVATIAGSTVTIVGAGTTTITASQAGNTNYNAATDVPQTLTVNSILYSNQFTGTAACPTQGNTASFLSNMTGAALSRNTITCTTAGNVFNSTTLNNTASIVNTSYIEFSATANTGYRLNLTSLTFFRQATSTAPNQLEVRYSTDGFATSTTWGGAPVTPTSGTNITWDFTDFSTPYSGTVTFRFYPYGTTRADLAANSSATGSFRLDDVTVNGTVSVIPATSITSSLAASGSVGTAFNYATTASNSPSGYAATGLPAGLSINTTTGVISGTPSQLGTFNVSLSATNAGGSDNQTLVITITQGSQSITFGTLPSKTFGDASFSLTGTASSGLAVTYTSSDTNVATISGSTVTIVGGGSTTITASQPGNANYTAATDVQQTLTVNKASQSITFTALASKNDTDGSFSLTATASSGLTVAYSSSNTNVISISGSTATIVGSGTATITASQAGDNNYNAATSVQQNQVIINTLLINQTITFNSLTPVTYGDDSFNLVASSDSGLAVTFASSDSTVASVSGTTVTILKPGSVTITASQSGNSTYNAATDVQRTLAVNQKTLTVSGISVASKTYDGTNAATITAATLNGKVGSDDVSLLNAPTFASVNAGNAVPLIPNFTLTGTNFDRYILMQPTGLTGVISKATQTISFGSLTAKTFGDAAFTLSATGGASGNAVTFASSDSNIASVSGNTVTILSGGTVTITASQGGNSNYDPAIDVPQTLIINPKAQTITFSALTNKYTTDAAFTLTATATSLATVTFTSSNPAVATVNGTTVTIVGVGTTNITASQSGNANYLAATDVVRSFRVSLPPVAAWNVFGLNTTSTATATTFNSLVTTGNANFMTRGAGAAASAGANSFRTVGFQNNGISTANTDFFQVTLQPVAGMQLSLSSIDAVFNGTAGFFATPGVTSQFAYSLNGTSFTLIGSPVQSTSLTMATVDLSAITQLQNIANGTTITLRYYASGQSTTGGWGFSSGTATSDALAIGGTLITVAPTVSDQSFCQANNPKVSNLVATGTAIQWYASVSGGSALTSTTTLTSGTYYVSQTINGIESARTAVLVTINNSVAGTISGNQTITTGTTPTNIVLSNYVGSIQWQSSLDGVNFLNINGATNPTLLGTTIGALTVNRYIRAVVTSGTCAPVNSDVSTITITCCKYKFSSN